MASRERSPSPGNGQHIVQPDSLRLTLVMFGLCLAVFLTGMDQMILATATAVISNEFNTLEDLGWWTNAYLLTVSSLQLFYGKLYSVFSIKLVYLIAIALFELGTLVYTTAPNSIALIIGRAIAGSGAAGIFSGSILITAKMVPLAKRPAYLGIMSSVFGRWCFGINLPLGAVTVILCGFFVRTPADLEVQSLTFVEKLKRLDIPGTGGSTYPWSDGRIIALFVVFGVLAIAFVVIQMTSITGSGRTIPSSLARNRDVWLSGGYAMCISGGVYVLVLYLPIWFQTVHGYSALKAGTMLTPLIASYIACSVLAGAVTTVIGYYNPGMIAGTVLAIAGSAVLTTIKMHSPKAQIVGFQLLYGFGVGLGFGQPSYVVQTVLPAADVSIGVTFITLLQNLSSSIFVAVAQTVFQGRLRSKLHKDFPHSDVSSILNSGTANFRSAWPEGDREVALGDFSTSLVSTFYISLALSCLSAVGALCIRWGSMKKDTGEASLGGDEQRLGESDGREKKGLSPQEDSPTLTVEKSG
ncbi:MFS thioclapurine efflux transporter tcpA [Cladobotryum mycophilum]|uniref:MFS thioclapurine efflux transporter tcpA n=1 Tax=Cladobotryum mycophilum TaxID=491253 RepID=A0ABR0SR07_9HYPO